MLRTRTTADWSGILIACGVRMNTAMRWAPHFAEQLQGNALSAGEVELDDFLGQILYECGLLDSQVESLNYSTDALVAKYVPDRMTHADAQRLGRLGVRPAKQEEIANLIYGGAFGRNKLGNTQPGDGWRFRGRSPTHLTGRYNYGSMSAATGFNLLENPDQLATDPRIGLAVTIRWWEKNLPDSVMDNLPAVTKRVNGGTNGIDERGRIQQKARRVLA